MEAVKVQEIARRYSLDIRVPRVAVVGAQSSGKSSVLESIVGMPILPRGVGRVTQCPILVTLCPAGPVTASSTGQGERERERAVINGVEHSLSAPLPLLIEKEMKRTCKDSFSSVPIEVVLYLPEAVSMVLIDLPGLIKLSDNGISHKEIESICINHIKNKDTLILAVSPANTDIMTSDSLRLSREADPCGERTVGVITKIDIMDKGTSCLDILNNKGPLPLPLGYIGVVCRGYLHTNSTREEHSQRVQAFFRSGPYSEMHGRQEIGEEFLIKKIKKIFNDFTKKEIPALKEKIKSIIERKTATLEKVRNVQGEDLLLRIIEWRKRAFAEDKVQEIEDRIWRLVDRIDAEEHVPNVLEDRNLLLRRSEFEREVRRKVSHLNIPITNAVKGVKNIFKDVITHPDKINGKQITNIYLEVVAEEEHSLLQRVEAYLEIERSTINYNHSDFNMAEEMQSTMEDKENAAGTSGWNDKRIGFWSKASTHRLSIERLNSRKLFINLINSYFTIIRKAVKDHIFKLIRYTFIIELSAIEVKIFQKYKECAGQESNTAENAEAAERLAKELAGLREAEAAL